VPNRLTRVPDAPVPELPAAVRLILPLADAFMLAMVSRPATGSLRTTWVTPATLQLSAAAAVISLALGAFVLYLVTGAGGLPLLLGGLLLVVLGLGSGAVAIVGITQRLGA
jgi:hypothetical protein